MEDDYLVTFLDSLPPEVQRRARRQLRALQSRLTLPIFRRFEAKRRGGGLRSNFWDDLFEWPSRLDPRPGRPVVALAGGEVVAFLKAPLRVRLGLARLVSGLTIRSPGPGEAARRMLATPGLEVWCANSLGVDRRHQGRGLARRLIARGVTQFDRPTVVVTGHESANRASRHLHQSLGLTAVGRVQVLHLDYLVYLLKVNMPGSLEG